MSDSALKGGAVFEGEGQAAIRVGCGVVGGEVGSSAGLAAERLAVTDFLQVVQAAGDALIAVRVEGVRFDEGEMNYFRNSNEKWTTAINGKKKTQMRFLRVLGIVDIFLKVEIIADSHLNRPAMT